MLKIKERPQILLLLTAFAFLFAIIFPPVASISFQDITMFSIPMAVIVRIIPLFLLSLWLLYLLTMRFLYSSTMTWIHVLVTVSAAVLIATVLFIGINPTQSTNPRHELIGTSMQILSLLFVFAQLIYLINVFSGLFTNRKINFRK